MPTLLVLAAGLGSRYGGLKQIDPVGPAGETLLDYGVFDAIRAGFERVVFVIRRDFEAVFREKIAARYERRIEVGFAFQSPEDLPEGSPRPPPGREKPWGTGQAVWCARNAVGENFAVINADDFYGPRAYRLLISHLGTGAAPAPAASRATRLPPAGFSIVGYRLQDTLSEHGAVSRGICSFREGRLERIEERAGLRREEVGPGRAYSGEEIVSMNCWGFTPALFPLLGERFGQFLAASAGDPKAEFYLPAAVSALIAARQATAALLETDEAWFGMTHREDKPRVAAAIAALVRRGAYPAKLF